MAVVKTRIFRKLLQFRFRVRSISQLCLLLPFAFPVTGSFSLRSSRRCTSSDIYAIIPTVSIIYIHSRLINDYFFHFLLFVLVGIPMPLFRRFLLRFDL